jgi:8-oxo-dGTP diphosphatase
MGAVGVLFDDRGRVLLVEHIFHPKVPWGLPGGWVARKENPADTVRREILEELSLAVDVGPMILADTPFANHVDLAYLCRTKDTIGHLSYELNDYHWFEVDELPELAKFHSQAVELAFRLREAPDHTSWLRH